MIKVSNMKKVERLREAMRVMEEVRTLIRHILIDDEKYLSANTSSVDWIFEQCQSEIKDGRLLFISKADVAEIFLNEFYYRRDTLDALLKNSMKEVTESFEDDLTQLISKYNMDAESKTPSYILSRHLLMQLKIFESTTKKRSEWYDSTGEV